MQQAVKENISRFTMPVLVVIVFIFSMWKINNLYYGLSLFLIFSMYSYIKQKGEINLNRTDIIVLLFVCIQYLLGWCSEYKPTSFQYLHYAIYFMVFYFILRFTGVTNAKSRMIIIIGVSFSGILLGIGTIFSFLSFKFQIYYEGFTDFINFKAFYNPFGKFSNDWVSFLLFFLTLNIGLFLTSKDKIIKWVSGIGSVILGFGLIISFSRGAYLSMMVFFIVLFVLLLIVRVGIKNKMLLLSILIVGISASSMIFKTDVGNTLGMNKTTSQARSTSGRLLLWEAAVKMFKHAPVAGVGVGNYTKNRDTFIEPRPSAILTIRVTNTFLQILAEQGIVGLVSWGLLVVVLITNLWKKIYHSKNDKNKGVYAAVILSGCCAFGVREMTFSSLYSNIGLFLLLALVMALSVESANRDSKNTTGILNFKYILSGILIILAVTGNIIYAHSKKVNTLNNKFIIASFRNDYNEALKLINKAIKLQPNNAVLFANRSMVADTIFTKGTIYSSEYSDNENEVLNNALRDITQALQLSPTNNIFRHNAAVLLATVGKTEKAKEYFDMLLAYEPYNPIFNVSYGMLLNSQGDSVLAKQYFFNAVKVSPEFYQSDIYKAQGLDLKDSIVHYLNDTTVINSDNPIILARCASLLLHVGDTAHSKSILKTLVNDLPNMNRPWYHLGLIALSEGDTLQYKEAMYRSILLDNADILPQHKMAEFNYDIDNYLNSISYYLRCLYNRINIKTIESAQIGRSYKTNTLDINILPTHLFIGMKKELPIKDICLKLGMLYDLVDKPEYASEFKTCAEDITKLKQTLLNIQNL